jgi:predicted 3-demethylubiquinone-9 3-methyltransferase (glyoxalase superfamily)
MPQTPIVPCLWFDDQAEAAAQFYTAAFPGGRIVARSHYPESFANPGGRPPGSVLTVEFEIAGRRFTALNGGPMFAINPTISFFAHVDAAAEADRLFGALAEGGQALMPLDAYPWSERYGWVQDRFGVSWQVIAGRRPPEGASIVPCLMFSGQQQGRAEEAIRAYTEAFPGSRVADVSRYEAGEGPEGWIKHGRFVLSGQDMTAMDSHLAHGLAFSEAVSLQVLCDDQAAIDRYWTTLAEGGGHGPCGWLKDRFGVSWQVVPSGLAAWLSSPDAAARDRAFQAMLRMAKLDIAVLQAAFEGR